MNRRVVEVGEGGIIRSLLLILIENGLMDALIYMVLDFTSKGANYEGWGWDNPQTVLYRLGCVVGVGLTLQLVPMFLFVPRIIGYAGYLEKRYAFCRRPLRFRLAVSAAGKRYAKMERRQAACPRGTAGCPAGRAVAWCSPARWSTACCGCTFISM